MEDIINSLENENSLLEKKISNYKKAKDTFSKENIVNEIQKLYNSYQNHVLYLIKFQFKELKDICDNANEDDKPQCVSKLKSYGKEFDLLKKNINQLLDEHKKTQNLSKLRAGELTGYERTKAERDFAVNLHKEVDQQGDIIKDIGKDIRNANANLGEIAVNVDAQGKQILRMNDTVQDGQRNVIKTNKLTKSMLTKEKCTKCILWFTNILIFISIIAIIGIKGRNHYVCTHQTKSKNQV